MKEFIIIDDDDFSNSICSMILKKFLDADSVNVFTSPITGMDFLINRLEEIKTTHNPEQITLLLDINMPEMSGWEFLEQLGHRNQEFRNYLKIFILSSSVSQVDLDQSQNNSLVTNYIIKPLTREKVSELLK